MLPWEIITINVFKEKDKEKIWLDVFHVVVNQKDFVQYRMKVFVRFVVEQNEERKFSSDYDDFFKKEGIPELAGPFEEFVFYTYYDDVTVSDNDLLECFIKMYCMFKGENNLYHLE